jgi:putative glutathione S-transferase
MLNSAFDDYSNSAIDYYPESLHEKIDAINDVIYNDVNNGVYRAGFATTQTAYDKAFDRLFNTMDELEETLSKQRYLVANQITEADWRLFTTLVRFDAVYYNHFKTNKKRLMDCPNLWAYTRELYQVPGVAETVNMDHIKYHYFASHRSINPTGIVPKGPVIDFMLPHGRESIC